jgi:glycosyltransferase involved in cell wall biosynthesis
MKDRRERLLYHFGIRNADGIVVQTRTQQEMLRRGFGREAVVIPMPGEGLSSEISSSQKLQKLKSGRILWLGRVCEAKRPDRLLDLAAACPDLCFDLVGPGGDSAYAQPILERIRRLPNVTVHGRVTEEQLLSLYQETLCLCCTSEIEGFPNTFLEAWSLGIPVVSTFDPDGVIAANGLGAAVADAPGLAQALRSLLTSPQQWLTASNNARQYYLHNHSIERTMPKFEQLFRATLNGVRIDQAVQLQATL